MKMHPYRLLAGLLLLCFLLIGCQKQPEDPRVVLQYAAQEEYGSLEDYEKMLAVRIIPDDFVYYEDIAFIGEFVSFWDWRNYTGEKQTYRLDDGSGCELVVSFRKLRIKEWTDYFYGYGTGNEPIYEMPEQSSFCYAPENGSSVRRPTSEDRSDPGFYISDYWDSYVYNEILYEYRGINYAQKHAVGRIKSVSWTYGTYLITVSLDTDEVDPGVYATEAKDTFVGRLLDPDTAVAAKNQLNRAIFWRQARVTMKKAAPIAIPVICVLAVGIPTLVIYCRKKRRIRTQKEQGESNLE